MSLTCYIVDDEQHAIDLAKRYIQRTPGLILSGYALNPLDALPEISRLAPDIVFADIDMPDLNGLEFARLCGVSYVIFTTAFREYAPEAFDQNASDYLLKPFSFERFLESISRVRSRMPAAIAGTGHPFLYVRTGTRERLAPLNPADIRFITASDHYLEIHTRAEKLLVHLTLSEIAARLDSGQFSRIHKSHIVNHHFIQAVEPGQVTMAGNVTLPVGRAYREAFREKIYQGLLG